MSAYWLFASTLTCSTRSTVQPYTRSSPPRSVNRRSYRQCSAVADSNNFMRGCPIVMAGNVKLCLICGSISFKDIPYLHQPAWKERQNISIGSAMYFGTWPDKKAIAKCAMPANPCCLQRQKLDLSMAVGYILHTLYFVREGPAGLVRILYICHKLSGHSV